MRLVQILISVTAMLFVVGHLVWPDVSIDSITLALLIIAIAPWLAPLFKSLEFPGGWKLEFQELQRAKREAEDAGLLESRTTREISQRYSFQVVADEDPNLALAGLRIEIEKRLTDLVATAHLTARRKGISSLLQVLTDNGILTAEQRSALYDMVGILNAGAHGAAANHLAAQWTLDVGPKLLHNLDERIVELSEGAA